MTRRPLAPANAHRAERRRLAPCVLIGTGLVPGAAPAPADPAADMKILADGNDAQWQPAPPSLPKGMTVTVLSGDPAKPGPFTIRLTMPAGTVIAPHTHARARVGRILI